MICVKLIDTRKHEGSAKNRIVHTAEICVKMSSSSDASAYQ